MAANLYVPDSDEDDLPEGPSKSQLKREDDALVEIGRRLITLSKSQISGLPVNESLRDALHEWRRISYKEAQRRHLKRIAKLIRDHDPDEVTAEMDRLSPDSSASMAATTAAQRWCDRLLAEGNQALTEFFDKHANVNSQQLRQAVRKAKGATPSEAPTKEARALVKLIRTLIISTNIK